VRTLAAADGFAHCAATHLTEFLVIQARGSRFLTTGQTV
jgi:hypothetical protein